MRNEQVLTFILKDGSSTGIVECTIDEWYGVCYKIPRIKLKEASHLDFIQNSGVYVLLGEDGQTLEKVAYIGQAE